MGYVGGAMASESGCVVPGNNSQHAAHSRPHRETEKKRALGQDGEGEKTAKAVNRGHTFREYR